MESIRRNKNGDVFFIDVRAESKNLILGCRERWYFDGSSMLKGIQISEKEMELPSLLIPGEGIPLGDVSLYGRFQNSCYDEESVLFDSGAIATYFSKREFMRGSKDLASEVIRVGKSMPKGILGIMAGTSDKIVETAKMLRLPNYSKRS